MHPASLCVHYAVQVGSELEPIPACIGRGGMFQTAQIGLKFIQNEIMFAPDHLIGSWEFSGLSAFMLGGSAEDTICWPLVWTSD